jgi:hypothetical protein
MIMWGESICRKCGAEIKTDPSADGGVEISGVDFTKPGTRFVSHPAPPAPRKVSVTREEYCKAKNKWALQIAVWAESDMSANEIFDGICHDMGIVVEDEKP